jgi:hypothetical protein
VRLADRFLRIWTMDTGRVDICYRPLRIAWAIHSSDREAFRRAVRRTNTMWGGRFNPIVLVDGDDAAQLVELYRADVIAPVGDREDVREFPKRFPHLIDPFIPSALYVKDGRGRTRAQVLDIQNALYHWRKTPEWQGIDTQGVRQFVFDADDPLADAFLAQYGDYPDVKEMGIVRRISHPSHDGHPMPDRQDRTYSNRHAGSSGLQLHRQAWAAAAL